MGRQHKSERKPQDINHAENSISKFQLQKTSSTYIIMIRFLVLLFASIFLIPKACNGGESFTLPLSNFMHAVDSRNTLSIESEKSAVPPAATTKHYDSSLKTWQGLTFFILGVVLVLFVVTFFSRRSGFKGRKALKEFDHHQSPSPSPIKEVVEEVVVKAAERRSELVFFVEEERFGLEELLEGVADLRSQGFWSSLYVVRLKNGAVYGVKRLRKLNVSFEEFGRVMRRVGNLRHPNLLPLVSYNNTLDEKLLIYRFQRNGSLLDLFQEYGEGKRAFPWRLRLSIAMGIARGLEFIHQNHDDHDEIIPHGMIKLSNIMLSEDDEEPEPLISEYGYAKFVNPSMSISKVSDKGDVYSLGVILLQLLSGKVAEELPRWVVRSVAREEWRGEVFDEEVSGHERYAFPLLNVSLKCVAHHPCTIAEVVERIQEVVNAQEDDHHAQSSES